MAVPGIEDHFLIFFGGEDINGTRFNSLYFLILPSFTWVQNSSLLVSGTRPSERTGHSAILFNHTMYVFGGEDS